MNLRDSDGTDMPDEDCVDRELFCRYSNITSQADARGGGGRGVLSS
jgi:hypothetical protein